MSAGGEHLPLRDSWPWPMASLAGDPGHESSSALEMPLAQGPVWIIDSQTLFRRGLALLLRQWNPAIAVLDAPDIATALAELGRDPFSCWLIFCRQGRGISPGSPG